MDLALTSNCSRPRESVDPQQAEDGAGAEAGGEAAGGEGAARSLVACLVENSPKTKSKTASPVKVIPNDLQRHEMRSPRPASNQKKSTRKMTYHHQGSCAQPLSLIVLFRFLQCNRIVLVPQQHYDEAIQKCQISATPIPPLKMAPCPVQPCNSSPKATSTTSQSPNQSPWSQMTRTVTEARGGGQRVPSRSRSACSHHRPRSKTRRAKAIRYPPSFLPQSKRTSTTPP